MGVQRRRWKTQQRRAKSATTADNTSGQGAAPPIGVAELGVAEPSFLIRNLRSRSTSTDMPTTEEQGYMEQQVRAINQLHIDKGSDTADLTHAEEAHVVKEYFSHQKRSDDNERGSTQGDGEAAQAQNLPPGIYHPILEKQSLPHQVHIRFQSVDTTKAGGTAKSRLVAQEGVKDLASTVDHHFDQSASLTVRASL